MYNKYSRLTEIHRQQMRNLIIHAGKGDQHSIYYSYAVILWIHTTIYVAFCIST
jgi:hypothetical protein